MRPGSVIRRTKGVPEVWSSAELAERCHRGRIILVDDDDEILAAFTSLLELEGYACEAFSSAVDYLRQLETLRTFPPRPLLRPARRDDAGPGWPGGPAPPGRPR